MPIITRVTPDMFEFESVVSMMVNPVNLLGVPGAGLALEFRKRFPGYVEPYREACRTKELRIGTLFIYDGDDQIYSICCLPTKRHYADASSPEDLARSLEALRDTLKTDRYKYATVGLPMLGCGLGTQDYEVVLPMMKDNLSDLDATVFISMAPQRTEFRPRYLAIAGPPGYELTDEDKRKMESVIDSCMTAWGTKLEDYEGIVSGGYPGVDAFICGTEFNKNYEDTLVYKRTGKVPLVVKADRVRNGVGANLIHNNLLCEIGDDIILFKPAGKNNNRLSAMQQWIEKNKEKRLADGKHPRRLAVWGEKDTTPKNEQIIIPVQGDED